MSAKLRIFVAAACAALVSGVAAHASETLGFDTLPGDDTAVPNGYGDLNWNNFVDVAGASFPGSGYDNGVVSPPNIAYDPFGNPASISATGPFTLVSGDFTAAWNNGLSILVQGYNGVTLVDSTSFVVSTSGPSFETFDWTNLTSVVFTPSGGTNAGLGGTGEHFALDNLTVDIPEPSAWALMLVGFAGLGATLRARRGKLATA